MNRELTSALLLVLLVLVAFGRTLGNGFAYDDYAVLVENPSVRAGAPILTVLTDPAAHSVGNVARAYRPVRTLALMAEHRAFGDTARPYHAVNLLLHAAVTLLAWRLARRYLSPAAALAAGALFACHPLQAEVVASIKAQDDLLAAILILSTVIAFTSHRARGMRRAYLWWLLIPFALGLLTKESVLALPILLAALWSLDRTSTRRGADRTEAPWGVLATMAVMGALFLLARGRFLAGAGESASPGSGQGWLFPDSFAWIPLYMKLFVWPHPLTIDHTDLAAAGFGSARLWVSVALQAIAAVLLWRTKLHAVRFGLVWFYIVLLPSLNLVASYFVFAERFVYLPLLGSAVLVAGGAQTMGRRLGLRRPAWALTALAVLPVSALTTVSLQRSGDWRDSETLFRSALRANPDAAVVRHFLISELLRTGKTDEARALLARTRVDDLPPTSAAERSEIAAAGLLAIQDGDHVRGAAVLRRVVASPYAKSQDWLNLGTALTNLGEHADARDAFHHVLEMDPADAAAYRMLGRIGLDTGDPAEARRNFEAACRLEPEHALGWYFSVVAIRAESGDEAAAARLDEATAGGLRLAGLFDEDATRWREAAPSLRQAIRRNEAAVGK